MSAAVHGLAGVGIKGAFQIKHEEGSFVIYVKMGACLGIGGDASMKYEVKTETIGEFFKCVAYQLKRADYHKIADAIEADAYSAFCQIKYLIIANGRNLDDFAEMELSQLLREYQKVSSAIDQAIQRGTTAADDFIRRIQTELKKQTNGWLSYAPPEVLGKIQFQVAAVGPGVLQEQAHEVMALALGAPQTINQLETIAEHMTPQMGDKQDKRIGFAMIETFLKGTENHRELADTEKRLAQAEPLMSKPFLWNSEPEFSAAKLGIEHPMFA